MGSIRLQATRETLLMAKSNSPPPLQPRAGDVVVLHQSQEHVEGEIITVLGGGRYRVKWETGVDYRDRITTVTANEIRKKV
jgi:hypothetical protein